VWKDGLGGFLPVLFELCQPGFVLVALVCCKDSFGSFVSRFLYMPEGLVFHCGSPPFSLAAFL
jgi:hypothetical protein